jgi:ubiquinone biosynthesis protein Coq4
MMMSKACCLERFVTLNRRASSSYSRLSAVELVGVAAREALRALADPHLRGDSVALVGEATGQHALEAMRTALRRDPTGRRLLEERVALAGSAGGETRAYLRAHLAEMPPRTLGGAYARYFSMHGFEFGERPRVQLIEDPEVRARQGLFVFEIRRMTNVCLLPRSCGALTRSLARSLAPSAAV